MKNNNVELTREDLKIVPESPTMELSKTPAVEPSDQTQAAKLVPLVYRVDEIAQEVDDDPRALYFEQARCGMYARMALLMDLACQPHRRPEPVAIGTHQLCRNPNCITLTEPYLPPLVKETPEGRCCAFCDQRLPEEG